MASSDQKQAPAAKDWCFTSFDEEAPRFDADVYGWLEGQQETCPETGRRHWQCYAEFKTKRRLSSIKKLACVGREWHWEKRRGTSDEASAYCKKPESAVPGTYFSFGVKARNGVKRTFDEAVGLVASAGRLGLQRVRREMPDMFVRYHRGLKALMNENAADDRKETPRSVYILWGPPGTGKSSWVSDRYPDKTVCRVPATEFAKGWLSGYSGQDVVVIEDYVPNQTPAESFLQICDRYNTTVPVKGDHVPFVAEIIVITSNYDPRNWFPPGVDEDRVASLRRRVTGIVPFRESVLATAPPSWDDVPHLDPPSPRV